MDGGRSARGSPAGQLLTPLSDGQRALVRLVHGKLAEHVPCRAVVESPVYRHYEDEELGIGPMGDVIGFSADLRGLPIVVRSDPDDRTVIELYPYGGKGDSAFHVRFTNATQRALALAGFVPWLPFRRVVTVREVAAIDAIVQTVVAAAGERLTARQLPEGLKLPWTAFIHYVLFADAIEGEVEEHGHRVLLTRCGAIVHRVHCDRGTNEDRVLAAWPHIHLHLW
jgi:hypothetical protein